VLPPVEEQVVEAGVAVAGVAEASAEALVAVEPDWDAIGTSLERPSK